VLFRSVHHWNNAIGWSDFTGWCFQQGFYFGYKVGYIALNLSEDNRGEYHLNTSGNYLFGDAHVELISMDEMSKWVVDGERYPPDSDNPWAVEK